MVDQSLWTRKVNAEPQHSHWFVQRFRTMAAEGKDIAGEARFVDAMVPREATIFDAGCGSGRTGGPLAAAGHTVIGVDVDPVLIEAAEADWPGPAWHVGDLAELDADALGVGGRCDAVVAAGNVMAFVAPSTRREVLARLRTVLAPGGRAALGFGAGRGYPFDEFFADVAATGWRLDGTFSGWNLLPFTAGSEFLVAVLAPSTAGTARHFAAGAAGAGIGRLATATGHTTTGDDPMAGHTLRPL